MTALRFATGPVVSDGLTLLSTLPIALLAVYHGWRGGVAGAAMGLGLGLFALWAVTENVDVSGTGYLTQASALFVLGGLVGFLSDERSRRIGVTDTRWFEMSNDVLCEASLDGYFTRLSDRWERCLGLDA